ncbi:MAG: hypothetical protein HY200_10615 [Nitrospirae bacterium]|nr:hypothetical protein [Nitrospirota bacterium]MBI3595397.1 hypothetical protein [Nitrospirota bacterium]
MKKKIGLLLSILIVVVASYSYSDLFAKQKAIHSVQNYRAGKNRDNFKSWLEEKRDAHIKTDITWDAGRLKKGLWVVQVTFLSELNEERFFYLIDLSSGNIRGADSGFSEQTLKEFEESSPEYI